VVARLDRDIFSEIPGDSQRFSWIPWKPWHSLTFSGIPGDSQQKGGGKVGFDSSGHPNLPTMSSSTFSIPKDTEGNEIIRGECTQCTNCRGFLSVRLFPLIFPYLTEPHLYRISATRAPASTSGTRTGQLLPNSRFSQSASDVGRIQACCAPPIAL
jgi:hypothetical protein